MAWFTCMAGVGGKGNSVIVTCDADFAGVPITCTNGQKTYTKVCPSFSPYEVTFTGLVAGTWTISATVDGVVYSTTAIVTDITAVLSYGFNWKMWVDSSSSLHSSDYTDLADLLSDEAAIRQLFTEHAPTDYAASTATVTPDLATVLNNDLCAKWINLRDYALDTLYANPLIAAAMDSADKYFYGEWGIVDDTTTPPTWGAKGNVPIMTANNAPYGEASASSVSSGYDAWRAFMQEDDGEYNRWVSVFNVTNAYIQYKFVNPTCVKKVSFKSRALSRKTGDTALDATAIIQASNDGFVNDTHDLATISITAADADNVVDYDVSSNDNYYLYYRIQFNSANIRYDNHGYCGLALLQFYGRELSVSVPKMDTNTTPYGEAIESSEWSSSYSAYKAFASTSVSGNGWGASSSDSFGNAYVGYDFLKGMRLRKVLAGFEKGTSNLTSVQFRIEGANDKNGTWTPIDTITMNTFNAWLSFDMDSDVSYRYIRGVYLNNSASALSYGNGVHFQFYGLDYSEREFEEGTNKKWLYDHGVELETLDFGTTVKGDSYVYFNHINSVLTDEISPHSKIDLTPYSSVRIKNAGRNVWAAVSSVYGFIAVSNAKNVPYTQWSGYIDITPALCSSYAPNNISYDISSFNEEKYISIGSTDTTGRKWDISEWWLE